MEATLDWLGVRLDEPFELGARLWPLFAVPFKTGVIKGPLLTPRQNCPSVGSGCRSQPPLSKLPQPQTTAEHVCQVLP